MEVINIIVHDSHSGIISIDSFGVMDAESKDDVIEEAEEFYREKCLTIKYGDEKTRKQIIANGIFDYSDIEDYIDELNETFDDGYTTVCGITVSMVHSYIENIQL